MLVTIEGIDGSGKSTLAKGICNLLQKTGKEVSSSYEPGGTPLGENIRRQLLRRSSQPVPLAEALLYIAARVQLIEQIVRPALNKGAVVVLDRFYDSTFAYQGYGHGLDLDFLRAVNSRATGGIIPALTLLLDVDPSMAATRLGKTKDRIEAMDLGFHNRVRTGYLRLAKESPDRFFVIDASLHAEIILSLAWERLNREIGD